MFPSSTYRLQTLWEGWNTCRCSRYCSKPNMQIVKNELSTLEAVSPSDDIVQSNCTCIHITHSVPRVTATCCRGSVQWGGWAGARYPGRATISWSSQCHTTSAVTRRHEHQLIRTSQTSVIGAVFHSELLENVTYIYTLCSCIAVTETVASLHIATRWFNRSEGSVLCLLSLQWDAKENYSDCWNSGNLIMTTLSYVSR